MASNFSLFSAQLTDENLLSSFKIRDWWRREEHPDRKSDGSTTFDYLKLDWKLHSPQYYGKEIGIGEMISHDILDLLPSDPFGMDISARFTTITGWIEGVEKDIGLGGGPGFRKDEAEVNETGDEQMFSGFNFLWKGAARIFPEVGDIKTDGESVVADMKKESLDGVSDASYVVNGDRDISYVYQPIHGDEANNGAGDVGAPPDALFFALGYLGVRDLLSVEGVCKSLRDAVQNDPLLWRNIHIGRPLSERLTDYSLLDLVSRAEGSLESLSLVDCMKITDDGIGWVLRNNPRVTKLSLSGCKKLSLGHILATLKAVKSEAGVPGIKLLRVAGISEITQEHFKELNSMLAAGNQKQPGTTRKPLFYRGELYVSFDDDRAIDIDVCPKCQQLRIVYDCPVEGCRACRGCTACVARCLQCGCCFNGREYMETFSLDNLCLDCLKQLLSCKKRQESDGCSEQPIFYQQASYHFCFYG